MIYKVCIEYKWRAARQDKKPKMTPANNYGCCRVAETACTYILLHFDLILMTEPKLAVCSGWHQDAVSSTGVHRAIHFILPTIVMDFFEIETCHCPKWRALLKFTAEWWDQTGHTQCFLFSRIIG